ncbi:OLC1v1006928C3 [Oldenlandia corymbosa var. corymbosa]|uniref:OLC1v1006928C3 n=1 Tax=Oldenlandia corymbosa var. corymbosa TaxID=529605 RepID=A0AAV1DL73_OLDCO|nr:OLC1v1006928C3 [Oldenlandia corymbosa var. corymbosa]
MANSFASPVDATQVGSFFVQQYYQILQQQPDHAYRFYTDASSVIRVDGDVTQSASTVMDIHELVLSMNFAAIEVKTLHSLDSWNRGVIVVVSGNVKSKEGSNGWRKFVQTFFLAPQENGFFVLNDIFHYVNEEVNSQPPAPETPVGHQPTAPVIENELESQATSSIPIHEQPVSDYPLEAKDREYVTEVHVESPVEDYNFQPNEPELNHKTKTLEEETPVEVPLPFRQTEDDPAQVSLPPVEEPVVEAPKIFSYASALRAPKGNTAPTASIQQSFYKKPSHPVVQQAVPATKPSQPALQQSAPATSVGSDGREDVEETSQLEEGKSKSIYVRNLRPGISTFEVLEEFKIFGSIKPDGVFVNNRPEIGVCSAFIEFDDIESAQKAVEVCGLLLSS